VPIPAIPKRFVEVTLKGTGEVKAFPIYSDDPNEHWVVMREEIGMSNWESWRITANTLIPWANTEMQTLKASSDKKPRFIIMRTRLDNFETDIIRFMIDEEELTKFLHRSNKAFSEKYFNLLFTYREIGHMAIRTVDLNGYLRTLK